MHLLCLQVIWKEKWNGWITTRRWNASETPWCGRRCGKETSVPSFQRSASFLHVSSQSCLCMQEFCWQSKEQIWPHTGFYLEVKFDICNCIFTVSLRPYQEVISLNVGLFQTLKHLLKTVTADNLISHRSLLHEGKLVLTGACSSLNISALAQLKSKKSFCVYHQRTQSW